MADFASVSASIIPAPTNGADALPPPRRSRRVSRPAALPAQQVADVPLASVQPGQTLAIKQSVLADVSCVLARSKGVDIDARQAMAAARNICEILFAHPQHQGDPIPRLFWDTPLGQAVDACYSSPSEGITSPTEELPELVLPDSLLTQLQREAEAQGKSVTDWTLEKLAR